MFFSEFSHSLLIDESHMKKKIVEFVLFCLCIFLFAIAGNMSCLAEMESSNEQPSCFQTPLKITPTADYTAIIVPQGPGSGGGRGPILISC